MGAALGPTYTQTPTQSTEAFRIRIANTLYGPVELSADKGQTWTLIARVQKAALSAADGGKASEPSVERASKDGVAFAVGSRRVVRVLPDLSASYKTPSGIVISLPPAVGLFRELLPPVGSPVQQILNKRESALPADYVPHDGDVLLFTCPQGATPDDKVADKIKSLGDRYREGVFARSHAPGQKPVDGTLTITVNVPAAERVNALTYFLDGEVVAIQNTAPFVLRLDTRKWTNGEHVLEARAVNAGGAVITQKKTLLYVENTP